RVDGSGGRAKISDRQRHPDRQHRGAGLGAGARQRSQQGRRCRAGRAGDVAHQTTAGEGLTMPEGKKKPAREKKANRRGGDRLDRVQALYQMDIAGAGINDVFAEFESHWIGGEVEGDKYLPAEAAFFRDIVSGVVRDQTRLDPLIDDALSRGWPLKRIDAILRAVLRAGAYELE